MKQIVGDNGFPIPPIEQLKGQDGTFKTVEIAAPTDDNPLNTVRINAHDFDPDEHVLIEDYIKQLKAEGKLPKEDGADGSADKDKKKKDKEQKDKEQK